jgi:hypothetical protein
MYRADSLLRLVVKDLGIEEGMRLSEIKRNWNALFNEPLSFHMAPSQLAGGELLLMVDSPVWLQELNFYRQDILKKLGSYGVSAIRFRLGRVSVKAKSGVRSQRAAVRKLSTTEQTFIQDTVAEIRDDGLKESLTAIMEKAITSGKTKIR